MNNNGPILCQRHARQVATEEREPEGECWPATHWLGGRGQTVPCDTIAAPEKVAEYFSTVKARRASNSRRAAS